MPAYCDVAGGYTVPIVLCPRDLVLFIYFIYTLF